MSSPRVTGRRTARKPRARHGVRMLPRSRVAAAVEKMAAPAGTARFAAGKAVLATAERDPARVYPQFEVLAVLLSSSSKVVRWEAIRTLAHLATVDVEHKLDAHLECYLDFLQGENMISAANAVKGAARIALARPDLRTRIVGALLEVERAAYETPECRNVVIGRVLDAFRELGSDVCRRPDVTAFIQRQRTNPRQAVARSAGSLLSASAAR